jgi:DNA-binding CsgD family transcriptional regulator/ligand-binding sensor protein
MERNLTFLQDIQDAYAGLAKLTMVIIDHEGKMVTNPSFQNDFSEKVFASQGLHKNTIKAIEPLGAIRTAVLLDSITGAKYILAPIFIQNKLVYYLFAGYILEKSSRTFIHQFIEKHEVRYSAEMVYALESIPESTEEEKREKIELVKKASDIISDYLNLYNEKTRNKKKFQVMQQSLELIRQDGIIADSLIKDILSTNRQFDFIGLALEGKERNGDYVVEFIEGRNTGNMKGHTFVLGEGFLGHTLAIEQFQLWKNASMDPRHYLFSKMGMKIKSLFCIPVFGDSQVKGVYFGGSFESEMPDKETREHANLKSAIISTLITNKELRANLQNHLMELSTFNEIFRVITSVEDIKRVLYILVDVSINVIRGPFSCIVSKTRDPESKVEIVSRGLTSEETHDYCSDVARRISHQTPEYLDITHPELRHTSWGEKVLEFPLISNDHFYGVLCVGCHPKSNPENYQSFLSSLAVAGSIALHLHRHDRSKAPSDYVIGMLSKILLQLGPEKYERTLRVKEIVEDFTARYYKDQTEILIPASLLVEFNVEIVDELLRDASIKAVLFDFYDRNEPNGMMNKSSEILALIHSFVEHGESIEVLNDLQGISKELKTQFSDYVTHRHVVESEISISKEKEKDKVDGKDLRELTQLSTREVDVLHLVLKGYSNNEIGSELYISDHTVKNHMTKILQKLGVTDRSQAIAKVYKLGYSPAEE